MGVVKSSKVYEQCNYVLIEDMSSNPEYEKDPAVITVAGLVQEENNQMNTNETHLSMEFPLGTEETCPPMECFVEPKTELDATFASESVTRNEFWPLLEFFPGLRIPPTSTNSNQKQVSETKNVNVSTESFFICTETVLNTLFDRIQNLLPINDNVPYNKRIEDIDWHQVAFDNYPPERCKSIWLSIQSQIRSFRLMKELVNDARNMYRVYFNNTSGVPNNLKQPFTTTSVFNAMNKIITHHSCSDTQEVEDKISGIFTTLTPNEHKIHSDVEKGRQRKYKRRKPERNSKVFTPFDLFFSDQLHQKPSHLMTHSSTFKTECRSRYENLPETKKIDWINAALKREEEYWKDRPDNLPKTKRCVLNKREASLKRRLTLKHVKPISAYALFTKHMHETEEIKNIPNNDRLRVIGHMWKNCTEQEKQVYNKQFEDLREKYWMEYARYVDSLPEDKRPKLQTTRTTKRILSSEVFKECTITSLTNSSNCSSQELHDTSDDGFQKIKIPKLEIEQDENALTGNNIFDREPEQPPESARKLYISKYKGNQNSADLGWKKMNRRYKQRIEEEVARQKRSYMKQYNGFLKSLTKEQLGEFMEIKRKRDLETKIGEQECNYVEESLNNEDDSNSFQ